MTRPAPIVLRHRPRLDGMIEVDLALGATSTMTVTVPSAVWHTLTDADYSGMVAIALAASIVPQPTDGGI